jgi:hypothetical protein
MRLNQPITRLKIQALVRQPFFLFHVVAATVVWTFVWRHGLMMEITYDEASSFQILKTGNYRAMPGIANTHWLNSFFMRLFMLFGNAPVVLRLHSIVAFPFFAHGVYRLATCIKSDGARFAFYCLAVLNPFILDFFALARGYGMALTFQVWAIVFFLKAVNTSFNYRNWMITVILSALAIASNLSYQFTIITIAGGYLLYCMVTDAPFSWYTNKQKRIITGLFVCLLFFSTVDLLFIKFYGKDLEFGGRENFVQSVFNTFWVKSLYKAGYSSISTILSWCSFVLITVACMYFTVKAILQKKLITGFMATFIIGGILILSILFHWLFDTPFFANRTALQWYIPGLLAIFLAISDGVKPAERYRIIQYGLGSLTGVAVMFHFAAQSNSRISMEYYSERFNRQPLYDLYALHPKHPGLTAWLAGAYKCYYSLIDSLTPPANFFWEYPNRPLNNNAKRTLLNSDYIICNSPVTLHYLDSTHTPYTIIKTYKDAAYKIIKLNH